MTQYAQLAGRTAATPVACDLRSDTLTRPDAPMRAAIAAAEVGDDVYGEDPTVTRLETVLAERLGKDAGLFLSSGTQSNLCALMAHCGRGDEAIAGASYHSYHDEAAGASVLAGIALQPVPLQPGGGLDAADVRAAVKADDPHYPISRLLCLENTVGGQAIPLDAIRAPAEAGRAAGLSVHLDGARFFNAVTALGCAPEALAGLADTVSICLSKGLGAPVGSVLVGPRDLIARARRHRKILGGGMRQAGVLAAAGLYALENNVARLAEDHARAERLAAALAECGAGRVRQATNMVFLTPAVQGPGVLQAALEARGVRIGGQSPEIRMVVHKDIDDAGLQTAIDAFREVIGAAGGAAA